MSIVSHHQVVPNGIVVANLSVGTWACEANFVVMAIMRFDVILRIKFMYNAKEHVLHHLSCI